MTSASGTLEGEYGGASAATATALHQMTREGPGKTLFEFPDDGVTFSSRFDGGSMAHVTRIASDEFRVTIPEDAALSGVTTGYTTWFYFEVTVASAVRSESTLNGGTKSQPTQSKATGNVRELSLVLTNMNLQRGLFANGYTIMSCVMDLHSRANEQLRSDEVEQFFENERKWMRLPTPLNIEKYTYTAGHHDAALAATAKSESKMKISFTHYVQFALERVRFAFCYPYTYTKIQRQLDTLTVKNPAAPVAPSGTMYYYHRDVLTHSLGGLPIELLTISSHDGIRHDHEPPLAGLYPDRRTQRAQAFDFATKKTVFITARVHPGETPASFMLDGMLRLLLHPTDPDAARLRRHFVFKIVPVLNPDGVCQGFYRTDTRGVNLNRVYESPQLGSEPAIYATKELLVETVNRYGKARARDSVVYLDLHAHANHRGCFVYGNSLLPPHKPWRSSDLERQAMTQVYAKLVGLHCGFFDYSACSFAAENMSRRDARDNNNATTSREGSSRVALFRATELPFVYTIECNYNEGRRRLETSTKRAAPHKAKASDASGASTDRVPRHAAPLGGRLFIKYAPAEWIDVGIGALLALLDLFQVAPGRHTTAASSAVTESPYRTVDGVKKSILSDLKAAELLSHESTTPSVSATPALAVKTQGSTRAVLARTTSQPAETPPRRTKSSSSSTSSSSSSRSIISKF